MIQNNKFIVTTSIYAPTEATISFCSLDDWTVIVVGDQKTPHEAYQGLNCIYLSPADQEKLYPELSDVIGWNSVQRRNIGFLHAYKLGAEIVATVDDDNIPYPDWGRDLYIGQTIQCDYYQSDLPVVDPLAVTNIKSMWHRGYPIELVNRRDSVTRNGKTDRTPLIQADLWNGDPDIDAIARLTQSEQVEITTMEPFCFDKISPFNSQNTFLARKVIPYYAVLPYVGRMDDIWASYLLQNIFPDSLIYNRASVFQNRHQHDLITDLERECIGYRHSLDFVKSGAKLSRSYIPEKTKKFYKVYRQQFI